MQVGIVGCGPSGLLAAHAAALHGAKVTVTSARAVKSPMSGAQYLHRAIPDLTSEEPDTELLYLKVGTKAGYATKVYGGPDRPCSWDLYEGSVGAWALHAVYDDLWETYGGSAVVEREADRHTVMEMLDEYDLVINTAPKWALCDNIANHTFSGKTVYISDTPQPELPADGVILYNGFLDVPWYRTSSIFGHAHTESTVQMSSDDRRGTKPTGHTCDCMEGVDRFLEVGRFGQWKKSVLLHDAFFEAYEWMGARHAV